MPKLKERNERALDVFANYYYPKAKALQEGKGPVGDPLMDNIPIYDVVERRYAGFSNVLEDIDRDPHLDWSLSEYWYAFMVHRMTGSGASFQEDHGYRNSIVHEWHKQGDIIRQEMMRDLVKAQEEKRVIFTSIGNQPAAPKGMSNIDFMIDHVPDMLDFLYIHMDDNVSHKWVVDYLNDYNRQYGHRRFNFQYAAFSMDLSDYYSNFVDPWSHTYLGNNAKRCAKLLFPKGYSDDEAMDELSRLTGGKPKDLEDVMCDFVRFAQNYDPYKRGEFFNASGFTDWGDRSV